MEKAIGVCPNCHTQVALDPGAGQQQVCICPTCNQKATFSIQENRIQEIDFYPVHEPFAYVKVLKDTETLDRYYKVIEPHLSEDEHEILQFVQEKTVSSFDVGLDEIDEQNAHSYLVDKIEKIRDDYKLPIDDVLKKKLLYYVIRESIGFGKIDPLMKDPNIEDISCDGFNVPIFLYHREYGSLKSNIVFEEEHELSAYVVKLAQKCGKHISIAEPMLDATMPDGSRIQMTLSTEVTAKGSTFTIRKFRADPFTPTDLINFNSMSTEMVAYMWLAVENGVNALVSGGTASGKTSTLNALSLFIPRDAKIVTIEETREINLPHPNWIPGVARSGFGEVVADRVVGEIDMYDLMKAALRQRPEYILVGEIRGKEAYVLFQAMATGHTTYSTFHADSAKALIHRLEGKPIEIPRIMLQSLDIVTIQVSAKVKGNRVRRCKQIVEIIDIDPTTREILTNEVFHWDPIEDTFQYSGKSYLLERIRARWDLSKEQILEEMKQRVEVLEWMKNSNIRSFKDVAQVVTLYSENPQEYMQVIRKQLGKDAEESSLSAKAKSKKNKPEQPEKKETKTTDDKTTEKKTEGKPETSEKPKETKDEPSASEEKKQRSGLLSKVKTPKNTEKKGNGLLSKVKKNKK